MKILAMLAFVAFSACAADTLEAFGRQWTVPAASDWKVDQEGGVPVLRLLQSRGPLPGPRRPVQFAIAETDPFSRVTVEADAMPLGRSLAIAFAYHDEAHFDYAHLSIDLATKQPVHNGIFHVYGGERVRISSPRGPAAFPETKRWYHVKLDYDAASGTVDVTVNGTSVPALHAVDVSLGPGKIGLGSFDETASFRNVVIRGSK